MQPSTFKPHPLADLFPLIQGQEFEDLVADIEQHGVREPITVTPDGMILDGRNRWRAAQEAEIDCPFAVTELQPDEWAGYVVSLNIHRRHLTESQRSYVAAELETVRHGGVRRSDQDANLHLGLDDEPVAAPAITRQAAADMLNVSVRSVAAAALVRERAVPELKDRVKSGEVSVSAASVIAKQPVEEQRQAAALEKQALVSLASQLRSETKELRASLPTKAAARQQAKEQGTIVLDRNGNLQSGASDADRERASLFLKVTAALRVVRDLEEPAETVVASVPAMSTDTFDRTIRAAATTINLILEQWERRHAKAA